MGIGRTYSFDQTLTSITFSRVIHLILGTRPEAIKLGPLCRELQNRHIDFQIICTGQHTTLLAGTGIDAFPVRSLDLPGTNEPQAYVDACVAALHRTGFTKPDLIIVQGDTASAMAGALYGVDRGIPVAHVEAGLRSHNLRDPWPEEGYRVRIDNLSTLRFCPTEGNRVNLEHETLSGVVTGNPVVDALRLAKVTPRRQAIRENGPVLITLHRRESFGPPLWDMAAGIAAAAHRHPNRAFCWPVHPNPKVQEVARGRLFPPNVMLRGPLPYAQFLEFLSYSRCVLTDSGGLVEEAATLGIPASVARGTTERPEACDIGSAQLCGKTASGVSTGIDWAIEALWSVKPSNVFGTGFAAQRIVEAIQQHSGLRTA